LLPVDVFMGGGYLVGAFDSGVGGLGVWREIVRRLPEVRTLYLADQAHVPYGSRSLAEVRSLSEGITRYLLDRGASVIVLACNTASAAALHHLRRVFPAVPFVGMEPAVKPATLRTRSGAVGVIATEATFQGDLFASLIARYAGHVRVIPQVCPGLVRAVEVGALESDETDGLLRTCLEPLLHEGIDQLVLGCTHYPFLTPAIERIVGPGVSVIDPAPAVARQTAWVLGGTLAVNRRSQSTIGEVTFCTTGAPAAFARIAARLLNAPSDALRMEALEWRDGDLREQRT
jgi:glutamate racemase